MSALLRLKSKWRLPSSTSRPIRFESSNAAPAQLRLPASWRLLDSRRVPEFDIDAVVLEHCRTRAQYLHMGAADANNAFSVSFRQAFQLKTFSFIAPVCSVADPAYFSRIRIFPSRIQDHKDPHQSLSSVF